MTYLENYKLLKEKFDIGKKETNIENLNLQIRNLQFESFKANILPGEDEYYCNEHNYTFKKSFDFLNIKKSENIDKLLKEKDSKIKENIKFNYSIFEHKKYNSKKESKSNGCIILFHGFNEKDWSKYLPWAKRLAESTEKKIILFPIAFHMNRAPQNWSDPKRMIKVNKERKKLFPNLSNSSFANAAISTRLQHLPQRFLWSGLQSYYDIIQLVNEIRTGVHPIIRKDESIDFFSYSIGSFLSLLLIMANPYNYFSKTKLFNFCGGPTLNRISAASKYILDSEANISVYSFFIEHLDNELRKDKRLAHYFSKLHPIGKYFKCMLDFHKMKNFREKRLSELNKKIFSIALRKDKIIPPAEVYNTLKGSSRNTHTKLKILDFKYKYDHVVPFPNSTKFEKKVDKAFNKVFKYATKHLK